MYAEVQKIIQHTKLPEGDRIRPRLVQAMLAPSAVSASASSLALVLVYLILVAQFKSFVDPVPDSARRADRAAGVIVIL